MTSWGEEHETSTSWGEIHETITSWGEQHETIISRSKQTSLHATSQYTDPVKEGMQEGKAGNAEAVATIQNGQGKKGCMQSQSRNNAEHLRNEKGIMQRQGKTRKRQNEEKLNQHSKTKLNMSNQKIRIKPSKLK